MPAVRSATSLSVDGDSAASSPERIAPTMSSGSSITHGSPTSSPFTGRYQAVDVRTSGASPASAGSVRNPASTSRLAGGVEDGCRRQVLHRGEEPLQLVISAERVRVRALQQAQQLRPGPSRPLARVHEEVPIGTSAGTLRWWMYAPCFWFSRQRSR